MKECFHAKSVRISMPQTQSRKWSRYAHSAWPFRLQYICVRCCTDVAKRVIRVSFLDYCYFPIWIAHRQPTNVKQNDCNYEDNHTIYTMHFINVFTLYVEFYCRVHLLWPQHCVCHIDGLESVSENAHIQTHIRVCVCAQARTHDTQ